MNLNVPKYPIKSFLAITFRSNPICPRLKIKTTLIGEVVDSKRQDSFENKKIRQEVNFDFYS